jgi:hypothetical protein
MVFVRGFFPATSSARFSRSERYFAMALLAPRLESANTEAPAARVGKAVGVNRHKQIRAVLVGNLHAVVQRDKGVARARQTGVNAVAA